MLPALLPTSRGVPSGINATPRVNPAAGHPPNAKAITRCALRAATTPDGRNSPTRDGSSAKAPALPVTGEPDVERLSEYALWGEEVAVGGEN